jgi:hypothetical protein
MTGHFSAIGSIGAFARVALVAVVILVVGCTPDSKNPLPEADRVAPDERLIGHWHGVFESADYVAEITRKDPLTLQVSLIETLPVGNNPVTKAGYLAQAYAVGSRTIMAFHQMEPQPGDWRFAVALISGDDRVSLMFMNEKFVRDEVFRSAFSGKIRTDDPTFPDVLITAKPEEISNLIRNTDEAKMFNMPFGPFERQPAS